MTENKRIKLVVNWLISQGVVESQQDLGEKLGITSKSYLSQLVNGKAFNKDFVNKLSSIDGRISQSWLETGEGEMIISPVSCKNSQYIGNNHGTTINGDGVVVKPSECCMEIQRLHERIDELMEQNGKLLNIIDRLTQMK